MKFLHSFTVGDWSKDGHNQSDRYIFKATHSREDIVKAYLETCEKLGIRLHKESNEWNVPNAFFCQYEDDSMSEEEIEGLEEKGLDLSFLDKEEIWQGMLQFTPIDVFEMFMSMVKFSIPEFRHEELDPPCINGWWNEDFNYQIGYGVFY